MFAPPPAAFRICHNSGASPAAFPIGHAPAALPIGHNSGDPPAALPAGHNSGVPPAALPAGHNSGDSPAAFSIGHPPAALHNSGEIDSPSVPSDSDIESLLSRHSEVEFLPINDRRKVWLDIRRNWKSDAKKISRGFVYFFVLQIEKQFQSIKYTEYLARHIKMIKHRTNLDDIFNNLVESHRKHDILRTFDKQVIWDCLQSHVLTMRRIFKDQQLFEYRNLLKSRTNIMAYTRHSDDLEELAKLGPYPGLSSPDRIDELEAYKWSLVRASNLGYKDPKMELYPRKPPVDEVHHTSTNPVSKVLLQKFQDGYEFDLNPVVELQKIKTSDPVSYYAYFLFWHVHMENSIDRSGLVRVDNVSLDTSKITIFKYFWPCGNIDRIEMTSGDKSQIAFVTFSHSTGADKALLLKDNLIDGQRVRITSISVYKPEAAWDADEDDVDYDYEDKDEDKKHDEKCYAEVLIPMKKSKAPNSVAYRLNPPGAAPVQEDACRVLSVLNKYWYYTRSQSMDEIC